MRHSRHSRAHHSSARHYSRGHAAARTCRALAAATIALAGAAPAWATFSTANPVLFVTQVPTGSFGSVTSAFGNHQGSVDAAPRGGDLVIRYPDGTLRFLTQEAGYGNAGQQGANAIAVREPCVHWSGTKALFSMLIGAPTARYQVGVWHWQIYEVSGLGENQPVQIRKIANQPPYNNISPIYATDGRILFTSDRPRDGSAYLYPQRDEYESSPIVAGIYSLGEASGDLKLLEHAPSGATSLSIDSFGRVIFTKWDHLQRDQQGDEPGVASAHQAFTYASEAQNAATTSALAGAEVYPEPRTNKDPAYDSKLSLHSFNEFFPWEINEDGTAEETLNHVGRHELGGTYTEGSFVADSNLSYYTPQSDHDNTLYLYGSAGLFHLREDPNHAGNFYATYATEFFTAAGGVLLKLTGAPSVNPDHMTLTAVTPTSNMAMVPQQTGYFRNPLPMTDGKLLASHTPATENLKNNGSTAAPNWSYAFRIKLLQQSGNTYAPVDTLTAGITKSLTWWTPDEAASWTGELWELDAVEVVARTVPAPRQSVLPAIEAGVFADEGVDVQAFRQYLVDNDLALIVSRDVTQRDRADVQQPFNLKVPGGTQSIGAGGTIYNITDLQIFQADALRGYGNPMSPSPGRRLLARPMHEPGVSQSAGSPAGAVKLSPDGSMAALVPARRALTWQLVDGSGQGIVRERNWISFQAGEIRVCANCHGINTQSQTGEGSPQNEPMALHALLQEWSGGGPPPPPPSSCTSGIALSKPRLQVSASPMKLSLSASALLPFPFTSVDPPTNGVHVVVDGVIDALVPGGAAWTTKGSAWMYNDASGAVAGVTSIRLKNKTSEPGRLLIKVRAAGAGVTLPAPNAVTATITFGADTECASVAWSGPGAPSPSCKGTSAKLLCR